MIHSILTPVLSLENISLIRGGRPVLKKLSFSIYPGEHWVILGPNGSGKSSLVSLLQGLFWPHQGRIQVLGRQFGEGDISEIRKLIGWAGVDIEKRFQEYETGTEIIESGTVGTVGLKFDMPTAFQKKKVRLLIREMQIFDIAKKPFSVLSQGEKRLVCIARALMVNPKILMLDEVCAGLDPVARELFLLKLKKLSGIPGGPMLLSATHHVEEIRSPFTHCLMIRKGQLFRAGPISKVLNSSNLSELFGNPLKLIRSQGRYQVQLQ